MQQSYIIINYSIYYYTNKPLINIAFFKLPMGVIFKNENITEDMIETLKKFQLYVPIVIENGAKKYVSQLCAGDQLTIERAVNSIHSVSNGYTPEDRLEGFTMQIGDWHTGVKILEVNGGFTLLIATYLRYFNCNTISFQ